jgi:hypothetical protein
MSMIEFVQQTKCLRCKFHHAQLKNKILTDEKYTRLMYRQ